MPVGIDKEDVLARINFEAFYSNFLELQPGSRVERMAPCIFHDDSTPSLSVNLETGYYNCHGCDAEGDVFTFYQTLMGVGFHDAVNQIAAKYCNMSEPAPERKPTAKKTEKPELPPIPEEVVEQYIANLKADPKMMAYLEGRGINETSVDIWQLGKDGSRITLPIRDADGKLVNIKKYIPNRTDKKIPKWVSYAEGYGEARLWGLEQLTGSGQILLCEGEFDRIVAIAQGYSAVTNTCGADTWDDKWTPLFAGQRVVICYDNDKAGREGAQKVAEKLLGTARSVKIVLWPPDMPEGGDITDWFTTLGRNKTGFNGLISRAEKFGVKVEPVVTHLEQNEILLHQERLLEKAIPKSGFLHEYVEYATETTDSPAIFHLFSALTALSAVCGSKLSMPYGDQDIHPNLWTVIIAASSRFRKSTALSIASRLLWNASPGVVLPNEYTPESLVETLCEQPSGIFMWSEIKNALSAMNRNYMEGTKEMLTEMYDVPEVYRRKIKAKDYRIQKPTISILAATTLDWLVQSIKAGDIAGGFTARFIYVPAFTKGKDIALPPKSDALKRNRLVSKLGKIAEMPKTVYSPEPIRDLYEDWYEDFMGELGNNSEGEVLAAFYSRLATYAFKIAMIIEASRLSPQFTEEGMEQAFAVIDFLKVSIKYLVRREFHTTKEAQLLEKIYRLVESNGGSMKHSPLLNRSGMSIKDFKPLIETLLMGGRLTYDGKEKTYHIKLETGQ